MVVDAASASTWVWRIANLPEKSAISHRDEALRDMARAWIFHFRTLGPTAPEWIEAYWHWGREG